MTALCDDVAKLVLPVISVLFENDYILGTVRANDQALIALLTILANFAASNDCEILNAVLDHRVLDFVVSALLEKGFVLQIQALKVICNLIIVVPDQICGKLLADDGIRFLDALLGMTDSDDGEMVMGCMEALVRILEFLATGPGDVLEAFKVALEASNIDCILEKLEGSEELVPIVSRLRSELYGCA
jgi:hypothetical protein